MHALILLAVLNVTVLTKFHNTNNKTHYTYYIQVVIFLGEGV